MTPGSRSSALLLPGCPDYGDRDGHRTRTSQGPRQVVRRAIRWHPGLAGAVLYTWLTLVFGLILLPSAFRCPLGISEIYMKILSGFEGESVERCCASSSEGFGRAEEPGAMGDKVRG